MPTKRDRTAYYAEYYKAHRKPQAQVWGLCACGCGLAVKGTRRRKFVDGAHRIRAHRAKAP